MSPKPESLLTELEQILGVTAEEVAEIGVIASQEHALRLATLVDSYEGITTLARRDLRSAYDHLFQLVDSARAPVDYVIEAFAEEEKAPSWRPKRLLETIKSQLDDLVRTAGSESEGELYVPVDRLLTILQNVMRPPWWKPGHGSSVHGFLLDLESNLETIIRLATVLRNAVAWAVANGHDDNEQRQLEINERIEVLWIQHSWYTQAFAPAIRGRILTAPSIISIASEIFDASEYKGRRPVQTVAFAKRLEASAREQTLTSLAFALAVHALTPNSYSAGVEQKLRSAHQRLEPLANYVVEQLFSKDKAERLNEWIAKTKTLITPLREDVQEQMRHLEERLTNLELIVSRSRESGGDRQKRIRALAKNLLELLREDTAWGGWPGKAVVALPHRSIPPIG